MVSSFGKKKKTVRKRTIRTKPALWKKTVAKVKAGNKGGKKGQWSARKAQLAVVIYKKQGGGYKTKKSKNNSLAKWTRQKWRTKSGKPSLKTGERYLPSKAIKKLSSKEYKQTSAAKRKALKKGKQYSKQPKKIAKKVKPYRTRFGKKKAVTRKRVAGRKQISKKSGIVYKGYLFKGIKKSKKSNKKFDAIFQNIKTGRTKTISFGAAGMSDYTKHRDKARKQRYINRHKKRENWNNLMTPGALSRWVLWGKPTLQASIKDYKRRLRKK